MLPWWFWWTFQSLFGGGKLKPDIFRALLKAVVMPLVGILVQIPFWLVAASVQCLQSGRWTQGSPCPYIGGFTPVGCWG